MISVADWRSRGHPQYRIAGMTRPEPAVTDRTEKFWSGGATGDLFIARCQSCGWWLHPPQPVCPECRSFEVEPEPVSGRGSVWSFTISRYQWTPELEPPYVIAEVELAEQPGLRLLTTIVDCDDIEIGMPVRVRFERAGNHWAPVFGP
jgi:uncharacterized OB-fold protein